jgi:hypothetical protein
MRIKSARLLHGMETIAHLGRVAAAGAGGALSAHQVDSGAGEGAIDGGWSRRRGDADLLTEDVRRRRRRRRGGHVRTAGRANLEAETGKKRSISPFFEKMPINMRPLSSFAASTGGSGGIVRPQRPPDAPFRNWMSSVRALYEQARPRLERDVRRR